MSEPIGPGSAHRGPGGLLAAARIYDDVEAPVGGLRPREADLRPRLG
jgi:hypothetical protein